MPVQARVGGADTIALQLSDIGARGMQLRMKSSDFEVLRKYTDARGMSNSFEIRISARLAWVMPESDGDFRTGWEFNVMDDEERIG
jgi:hypothetical protein